MVLLEKNRRIAQNINNYVIAIQQKGGSQKEILINMTAYLHPLQKLLDSCSTEEFKGLLFNYPGFYTFSLLLQEKAFGRGA